MITRPSPSKTAIENCHYIGRDGRSNIFTRKLLYDTIRLVDAVDGTVIAQKRFEGAVPSLCPTQVTRDEVIGDPPLPELWVTWVLENTNHKDLLPLRSHVTGPEDAPLFTAPNADSFRSVKADTIVNVVARSGEGWILVLLPDLSMGWIQTETVSLSASVSLTTLPELTYMVVPLGSASRAAQIANFAAYRPLGRVTLPVDVFVPSPDGYYLAGIQQRSEGAFLGLWDVRGGHQVWQVSLPNRQWDTLRFSPAGDTLMVKTNAPYPAEEEIRFTFYDALTGEVVSETGDVDIIDSPLVPGNMPQGLMAEPFYNRDGKSIMVSYYRRTEAPRCAIWDVHTGTMIWEMDETCGSRNDDNTYMISPRPYTDLYSAYDQLVVYEVASGAVLTASQDEAISFSWLTNDTVFIQRPYGEAPVIWNILEDTTAVMELPPELISFQPSVLKNAIYYNANGTTYVWDLATGELIADTLLQGGLIEQPEGIIVVQEYQEKDSPERVLRALSLETEEVVWEIPWHHSDLSYRDDGLYGFAYNRDTGRIDIFNLQTGQFAGQIPLFSSNFGLTDDWEWIVQLEGGTHLTVWGPAEAADLFDDPPHLHITAETPAYFESNTQFPYNNVVIRADQYLWVAGRTADSAWVLIEKLNGEKYWLPTTNAEFLVDLDQIPIR